MCHQFYRYGGKRRDVPIFITAPVCFGSNELINFNGSFFAGQVNVGERKYTYL